MSDFVYDEAAPVFSDLQGTEVMYEDGTRALLVQDEDGNLFIPTEGQFVINDGEQEQNSNVQQVVYYTDCGAEEENAVQLIKYEDFLSTLQVDSVACQYAVVKDGEIFLQNCPIGDCSQQDSKKTEIVDLSHITGKNLITGQTITLDGYIDKILEKAADDKMPVKKERFLYGGGGDKRFVAGRTANGKKLLGKIVRIQWGQERREQAASLIVKRYIMSRDTYDYLCRMLTGLMAMDSVYKKLINKNLSIKMIERNYGNKTMGVDKIVSHLYGYLRLELDGRCWKFVPIKMPEFFRTQTVLIEGTNELELEESPFNGVVSLTLIITSDKNGKRSIRVNLTPACKRYNNSCNLCNQKFCNKSLLYKHIQETHTSERAIGKKTHNCSMCEKTFATEVNLQKHMVLHAPQRQINVYECGLCGASFEMIDDFNLHLKIHEMNTRNFTCGVCGRKFSRHSNLIRHITIHKGEGALYQCEICSCSYNFVSSLTRHMVQKHIKQTLNGNHALFYLHIFL